MLLGPPMHHMAIEYLLGEEYLLAEDSARIAPALFDLGTEAEVGESAAIPGGGRQGSLGGIARGRAARWQSEREERWEASWRHAKPQRTIYLEVQQLLLFSRFAQTPTFQQICSCG